jgi:phage tail sheath protein FI
LIGVASKGPFDTPTVIRTTQDFIRIFGDPVEGDNFLATAVGIVTPYTDGTYVVRIGHKYKALPGSAVYSVTGTSGATSFTTNAAPMLATSQSPTGEMYVSITQFGKRTLYNGKVAGITGISVVNLDLDASGNQIVLLDTYTDARVQISYNEGAASSAESVLEGYNYTPVATLGSVVGERGDYFFTVTSNPTDLVEGDLLRITQTGRYTTHEVRVKRTNALVGGVAVIELQTTNDTERGYQALPLQDSYTAAIVSRATSKTNIALVYGVTEGTWANTALSAANTITGLQVQVSPGTKAGSKKLAIYWNSALVEVYDNLGTETDHLAYEATVNTDTPSNYVTIKMLGTWIPANTVDPWNATPTAPVPFQPTNTASPGASGAFSGGNNGASPDADDYVGQLNPATDTLTGIKSFEDTDNILVTHLCAPGVTSSNTTMVPVHAQLRETAFATKSIGLIDVPKDYNGVAINVWDAIDWHNGQGRFRTRGRFNTAYLACFWNWFTMNDPITQTSRVVPPTIGALRAMAYTWLHDQPWYAAAGEVRGVLSEATDVTFARLSDAAKEAMYGSGNCINPIIKRNGVIMLYGERTMQRTESKLTAIHNLVLVEYVVQGLAAIGRRYVFDPNDQTLLTSLNLAMTQFLDGVKALRGIEAYNLVCDDSNNDAASRNRREVIVDLYIIPTDVVERIYINAVVRESGADLTNVTG